ncbi:MAG: hypothetical protein Q9184_001393 [Pyrenodesmia sp. 2 TL-2023]
MHLLASVLCAASLVSAVPSKLSLPEVSIQVSIGETHRGSAIQPLASLPDKFGLEAISDNLAGAPFGAEYLHEHALLSTGQKTTFFLRDRLLMVNAPDLGDDEVLAVGLSILRIFPPLVAFLRPINEHYDLFEWEAVEKADGMYIEMTRESKEKYGELVENGPAGRVNVLRGGPEGHTLRLKVHDL